MAANDDDLLLSTVGVRSRWEIGGARVPATLTAGIGWQQAGGDTAVAGEHRFVGSGDRFGVAAAQIARSTALVEVGLSLQTSANNWLSIDAHTRRGDAA